MKVLLGFCALPFCGSFSIDCLKLQILQVPVFQCQKIAFRLVLRIRKHKNGDQFLIPTSLRKVDHIFVWCIYFWVGFQPILKIWLIWGHFPPLKWRNFRAKNNHEFMINFFLQSHRPFHVYLKRQQEHVFSVAGKNRLAPRQLWTSQYQSIWFIVKE